MKRAYLCVNPKLKKEIKTICSGLEKLGYSIHNDGIEKELDTEKIKKSDLFIFLANKHEIRTNIGLEIAITFHINSSSKFKKPEIYVIGKYSYENIYSNPLIRKQETIKGLLKELSRN